MSRRAWLRSVFDGAGRIAVDALADGVAEMPVQRRPPGALVEPDFLDRCTRCGDCVSACQYGAISVFAESEGPLAGTPVMTPNSRPCHMCAGFPCAGVCETGALKLPLHRAGPWERSPYEQTSALHTWALNAAPASGTARRNRPFACPAGARSCRRKTALAAASVFPPARRRHQRSNSTRYDAAPRGPKRSKRALRRRAHSQSQWMPPSSNLVHPFMRTMRPLGSVSYSISSKCA